MIKLDLEDLKSYVFSDSLSFSYVNMCARVDTRMVV